MPPDFEVVHERNRRDFAREVFRQAQLAAAAGAPTLGIHILMKADVALKLANVVDNLERGLIAPVELIGGAR